MQICCLNRFHLKAPPRSPGPPETVLVQLHYIKKIRLRKSLHKNYVEFRERKKRTKFLFFLFQKLLRVERPPQIGNSRRGKIRRRRESERCRRKRRRVTLLDEEDMALEERERERERRKHILSLLEQSLHGIEGK